MMQSIKLKLRLRKSLVRIDLIRFFLATENTVDFARAFELIEFRARLLVTFEPF